MASYKNTAMDCLPSDSIITLSFKFSSKIGYFTGSAAHPAANGCYSGKFQG